MDNAFRYIETAPLDVEDVYAYTGIEGKCAYVEDKGVGKVEDYRDVAAMSSTCTTTAPAECSSPQISPGSTPQPLRFWDSESPSASHSPVTFGPRRASFSMRIIRSADPIWFEFFQHQKATL